MTSFAIELRHLIRIHLGTPKRGDDFAAIIDALHAAAERLEMQADRYQYWDETAAQFRERVKRLAA